MAGIKLTALRAVNYLRGAEARANSPHTSMTGLLEIYGTSPNATVRNAAEVNICKRILSCNPFDLTHTKNLLGRLPTDLFKSLCFKTEDVLAAGRRPLESPFYVMVGEFGRRMDAAEFSVSDDGARKALENIISRLDDRRSYDFIIGRLLSGRRDFMLGMVDRYPEVHEKLVSDLLYHARGRENAGRAGAIETICDLIDVSSIISNEAYLINLYTSVRGLLNDKSDVKVDSAVIETGTRGNWRAEYDYEITRESYTYPLIRSTKKLLVKIGLAIKDENIRAQIIADLKAAPADKYEETNESTGNKSGCV